MVKKGGGRRHHDIYVGVDVFGRGCPGGGGWNTRHVSQDDEIVSKKRLKNSNSNVAPSGTFKMF